MVTVAPMQSAWMPTMLNSRQWSGLQLRKPHVLLPYVGVAGLYSLPFEGVQHSMTNNPMMKRLQRSIFSQAFSPTLHASAQPL